MPGAVSWNTNSAAAPCPASPHEPSKPAGHGPSVSAAAFPAPTPCLPTAALYREDSPMRAPAADAPVGTCLPGRSLCQVGCRLHGQGYGGGPHLAPLTELSMQSVLNKSPPVLRLGSGEGGSWRVLGGTAGAGPLGR